MVAARRARMAALAFALTLSAVACGGGSDDDPVPETSPTAASSPASPTTAVPRVEATVTPPSGPITMAFAGDIHFEGQLRSRLDDPTAALDEISGELSAADLTVVNLETAVGTGGTREPKRFTFQAPPAVFDALAAAGVDAVTMANNHAGDFGLDGLAETLDAAADARAAEPALAIVGIGADADEAFAPAMFDVDGTTVAVIGASAADHDPTADATGHWAATDGDPGVAMALEPQRLLDAIEEATSRADIVVAYLHWGVQGDSCPSAEQTRLAGQLAEAGAAAVVGSHTHRLQGSGLLGDTYVAYGLGNFVWYTQASEATSTTGVLTLTFEDGRVSGEHWAPARIASDGLPRFVDGSEAEQLRDDFRALRDCTDLGPL